MRCALLDLYGFLGKKWAFVLFSRIDAAPLSYNELQKVSNRLLNPSLLSSRLKEMVALVIVERKIEGGRVVYAATPKGSLLKKAMHAVKVWADDSLPVQCRGKACVCETAFRPRF